MKKFNISLETVVYCFISMDFGMLIEYFVSAIHDYIKGSSMYAVSRDISLIYLLFLIIMFLGAFFSKQNRIVLFIILIMVLWFSMYLIYPELSDLGMK